MIGDYDNYQKNEELWPSEEGVWPIEESACPLSASCAESDYGSMCYEEPECCPRYAQLFTEQKLTGAELDFLESLMFEEGEFQPDYALMILSSSAPEIAALV